MGGDFLSSEDVELLESLASYIGIALQNASLYARLEEKIGEFERLKEFNENIVESINVGILAIDLDDRIESWNAQMEAMYAFSRGEALGQTLRAVFPPDFCDAIDSFRNEAGVHHLYKFRLTTRAGEQRTANIAVAPLLSRDFVSVGRIILVDDITERVTLEAQLAQADKLSSIGLLAAGVAHEINTPLAVISCYSQMLSKQMRGDARLGPVLEKITQQSFRAAEIANGLLEFLAHIDHRIPRDGSEPGHPRYPFVAGASVQDGADAGRARPDAGTAADPGQSRKAAAGFSQPAAQRQGSDAGRREAARCHPGQRSCGSRGDRFRGGIAPEHLKRIYDPFFTTKTTPKARRQARHRTRALRFLRHHPGARRQDPCRKRHRRRHNLPS